VVVERRHAAAARLQGDLVTCPIPASRTPGASISKMGGSVVAHEHGYAAGCVRDADIAGSREKTPIVVAMVDARTHRSLPSFNSLSDDLSRGSYELSTAEFGEIPATVKIDNALGNFELLVISRLRNLIPQCKRPHPT
jgi:hypothetical protein